ncbi:hypothetical protein COT44_03120 [Candidatus Shapirobacteria bacterium CG08_land_8_20_14_0_20_39_18]|uniref:Uncharacterized protein n=1 Tax=Candidatus Shapirobacteria bacterium CG08_land_8_20_14_0_20_39_18 TaxID=1974883 RepID=A0A2M6XCM0_9BACT|nr:MAG: hypothetical protein COT44_03120 [Candidatus Shapirobacteria bacterium CG08_land_8_20_14_0_20_39_18]PIY66506.1 MAG: hypothetical protein COY91_00235 [Candidatus Shapirobacteria bacterium CG_4_10_14_0_8_um_filter_39_15]PJE68337.1 MAG: hypothetical protein COU94_02400 [Candidatus Shapirobacteria bacterium CG10_big_fil_rev_8_21_14_0_10_38_8]
MLKIYKNARIKLMDIDKEINRLKNINPKNPPSIEKMALLMVSMLDQSTVNNISQIFWDKKFRELIYFDKIEKLE